MLYSIGHSNKNIKTFVSKLLEFSIEQLVDVRTFPYSKFNPQFNRQNLEIVLPENKIKYLYRGKSLGGLGQNFRYEDTIKEMCTLSEKVNLCFMCSEGFQNISGQLDMTRFMMFVVNYFQRFVGNPNQKKATMFVGKPGAKTLSFEDGGETMVLPIDKESPKVYACINETCGLTFMLADEY